MTIIDVGDPGELKEPDLPSSPILISLYGKTGTEFALNQVDDVGHVFITGCKHNFGPWLCRSNKFLRQYFP